MHLEESIKILVKRAGRHGVRSHPRKLPPFVPYRRSIPPLAKSEICRFHLVSTAMADARIRGIVKKEYIGLALRFPLVLSIDHSTTKRGGRGD